MERGAADRRNLLRTRQHVDTAAADMGLVGLDRFSDQHAAAYAVEQSCRQRRFAARIAERHGLAIGDPEISGVRGMVLKAQMPAGPDESRFFGAILDALGMPFSPRDRIATKQDTAVRLMRTTGVRLLVIDELHNLLSGTAMQQRRLLNVLRWLGNELQIPLVGVGTAEALRAIRSDDQLVNRFVPFPLPLWTDDDEYRRLLSTLEAVLPLRKPSHLTDPTMAARILSASEGVLGEIIAIIVRAAVLAVETGKETISARTIEGAGFIRPSERRRVAI